MADATESEGDEYDHALAMREYEWLRQCDHQAHGDFEKLLTAISTGAIAGSLVLATELVKHPTHLGWLWASWTVLVVSLLCVLVSHVASQKALRAEMQRVETRPPRDELGWAKATSWLNAVAAGALVSGGGLLLVFAGHNV